jgi:hypothetical protein
MPIASTYLALNGADTQIIQANETYVLTAYTLSSADFSDCRLPGLGIY